MKTLQCTALVLAAALSHNALAQDLDARVVQDPNANLATYTIDIQGPPNGLALSLVSLLQADPVWFPNLLGPLTIDPTFALPLPFLPLNNQGMATFNLNGPLGAANGLPLFFQSVVLDPVHNNQLAFTDFGCAAPRWQPANPALPAAGFQTKYNNGILQVDFMTGPQGANVTVWVNGGQKAAGYLILDGSGQGSVQVPVPGGMQHGDNVQVLVNGVPMITYNH